MQTGKNVLVMHRISLHANVYHDQFFE